MDSAVALVEAYLRVNGYFTVTEYPVVEAMGQGRYQEATDLDVLAFRFPGAARRVPGESKTRAEEHPPFEPDPIIVSDDDRPEMIIGEVKQGAAELNPSAGRSEILAAALTRFGCCDAGRSSDLVRELIRKGQSKTTAGHRVRLVAFGSTTGSEDAGVGYQRIALGHLLEFLRGYIRSHWTVLRHGHFKDPVFSLLVLEEKARSNS